MKQKQLNINRNSDKKFKWSCSESSASMILLHADHSYRVAKNVNRPSNNASFSSLATINDACFGLL